jgi:hypothetical protein
MGLFLFIKYNQFYLQAGQPIRLQYSHQINYIRIPANIPAAAYWYSWKIAKVALSNNHWSSMSISLYVYHENVYQRKNINPQTHYPESEPTSICSFSPFNAEKQQIPNLGYFHTYNRNPDVEIRLSYLR